MDMDPAAPVIRDEQAKTRGQVGWIEPAKAESFERCRKRRLVLDLGQDDFDVKDVAGRHPPAPPSSLTDSARTGGAPCDTANRPAS